MLSIFSAMATRPPASVPGIGATADSGLIMLGDGLRHGRRGAGLGGVHPADLPLQARKLDDDLAHEVGLGMARGDDGRRQLAGDRSRERQVGGGGDRFALAGPADPLRQALGER